MKKTVVSILTTLVLVAAIPAVLVLAAPGALSFLQDNPTGAPTEEISGAPTEDLEPSGDPEPSEEPDVTEEPEATPENPPPALERVETAHALGIPPGRLLLIDRLAGLLKWTREQTLLVYGDSSVKDIQKLTNELRHSGKGHHPEVTPPAAPSATPEPTAEPSAAPTEELPAV
jgi:hypothetical protein